MQTMNTGDSRQVRRLFGEMAVHKGYCTQKDIEHALKAQRHLVETGQPPKLLGLILLEQTSIDNAQFIDLLKDLDHAVHDDKTAQAAPPGNEPAPPGPQPPPGAPHHGNPRTPTS